MIQTLRRNWWLLAFVGVLDAIISTIYLFMRETDGPLTFHSWGGTILLLGKLALAAGAVTIVAGIVRSTNGKCWLLVLNGLALGALGGVIQFGVARFPISFLTVALLIILMAMSMAVLELGMARTLHRQGLLLDGWFLALAGVVSIGFAVLFLALGFRWIKIEPGSHTDLLWLGCYFGFSAISLLGLALRFRSHGGSRLAQPLHPIPAN